MLKECYIFLFFATILLDFSGELPQDSGSPAGLPESNFRQPDRTVFGIQISPGRWDYAIC